MGTSMRWLMTATLALVGGCGSPAGPRPPAAGYHVQLTAEQLARIHQRGYYGNIHVTLSPPCNPPLPTGMITTNPTVEAAVLDAINGERTNAGLEALVLDDNAWLRTMARAHSYDVSGQETPSHNGTRGDSILDRLQQYCFTTRTFGELVGAVPQSDTAASDIVATWMGNDLNKGMILSPNYTQIGVGVVPTGPARRRYIVTVDMIKP